MTFRIVGSRHKADLDFLVAETLEVEAPDGGLHERLVVRHPGAAAVVLVEAGDVILVRQYRAPVDTYLLEIPAGKLDLGEDPEVAAVREAAEETGFRPAVLRHLSDVHTGPGFTDEVIHLYLGTELSETTIQPDGPEEHDAEILRVSLAEAVDLIDQGAITDSKTIIGLLLAKEVLA